MPHICLPFLNDVAVKGPTSTYNNEEIEPSLRRYVVKHIQNLDKVLCNLKRAGCTIRAKSQFCMSGLRLVGYVCDAEGRKLDSAKILKVLNWPPYKDKTNVKAFMGLCVYYWIWVSHFALVLDPLYSLLRKDAKWQWGNEQQAAMDFLKVALTSAPALVKLDYSEGVGEIILAVNASLIG